MISYIEIIKLPGKIAVEVGQQISTNVNEFLLTKIMLSFPQTSLKL
jgi:hypothetical protein